MGTGLGARVSIKISLAGDKNVGKTSLVSRYIFNEFKESYRCTIGAVYNDVELNFDGVRAHVQIWDTAGQERYKSLVPMYFRDSNIILLLFDVCDRDSFEHLGTWLEMIHENCDGTDLDVVVVGNKIDDAGRRVVGEAEARGYCEAAGLSYVETSAKTSEGVARCFNDAAEAAFRRLWAADPPDAAPILVDDGGRRCCGR